MQRLLPTTVTSLHSGKTSNHLSILPLLLVRFKFYEQGNTDLFNELWTHCRKSHPNILRTYQYSNVCHIFLSCASRTKIYWNHFPPPSLLVCFISAQAKPHFHVLSHKCWKNQAWYRPVKYSEINLLYKYYMYLSTSWDTNIKERLPFKINRYIFKIHCCCRLKLNYL